MSLRAFHLFFIAVSVIVAAFFGAWSLGEYRSAHQLTDALTGATALAAGVGLAVYGAAFQRKTRHL